MVFVVILGIVLAVLGNRMWLRVVKAPRRAETWSRKVQDQVVCLKEGRSTAA